MGVGGGHVCGSDDNVMAEETDGQGRKELQRKGKGGEARWFGGRGGVWRGGVDDQTDRVADAEGSEGKRKSAPTRDGDGDGTKPKERKPIFVDESYATHL